MNDFLYKKYELEKLNDYRYNVVVNLVPFKRVICQVAQFTPINRWYAVMNSINYELSEDCLRFILDNISRLNRVEEKT